jgi:hypothetical protein
MLLPPSTNMGRRSNHAHSKESRPYDVVGSGEHRDAPIRFGAHMESGMTLGFQGAPGPVTAAKVAACARGPLQWLSKEALEGDGLQTRVAPTPSA